MKLFENVDNWWRLLDEAWKNMIMIETVSYTCSLKKLRFCVDFETAQDGFGKVYDSLCQFKKFCKISRPF